MVELSWLFRYAVLFFDFKLNSGTIYFNVVITQCYIYQDNLDLCTIFYMYLDKLFVIFAQNCSRSYVYNIIDLFIQNPKCR